MIVLFVIRLNIKTRLFLGVTFKGNKLINETKLAWLASNGYID